MRRRDFIRQSATAAGATLPLQPLAPHLPPVKNSGDRGYWVQTLTTIADPVLYSLSRGKLKKNMPVEAKAGRQEDRATVTHLEAFGRLLAGMAPWLELGADATPEGKIRGQYLSLALQSLSNAVNPASPDFMNFTRNAQPLVDAAFLGHAMLRAPVQLTGKLDAQTRRNLVQALKATRVIKPYYSNWLLFSAMVEATLFALGEDYDKMRVDFAVKKHLEWYKGDGVYGDGENFHFDYYNSFVIQPMLLDVVRTLKLNEPATLYETVLNRARRYAAIQEKLISPEGTFPVTGRSMAYRFGAFQLLAQIALMRQLPEGVSPAQVRSGLTAVIRRVMSAPGTFNKNGWLTIGFYGHQPDLGEQYISTGSLYLCTTGLLPLGLPATDAFWSAPAADWTGKKIWSGVNVPADSALYD